MGPADGGAAVTRGAQAETEGIRVALVRKDHDPRPLVEVRLGDDHPALARLDLAAGATVRVGRLLAIRAGLPETRHGTRAVVPTLRIGELVLEGVRAELVDGDELVIGLDALRVPVAVLASEGEVLLGEVEEPPGAVAASLPDPDEEPFTDLVLPRPGGEVEVAPAPDPRWVDADDVRLGWLEAEAARWSAPEPRAAGVDGDPGDLLGRLRWGELAAARFAVGDLDGAAEADGNLLAVAGDRCDALLAAGTRLLRAGDPASTEVLERARALWRRWSALDPTERDRVRRGRSVPPGTLSVEQPDACGRAVLLLPGAPATFDDADPWPTARWGLDTGSEGALRFAIARDAGPVAPARLVLAAVAAGRGADELAREELSAVLASDDPHPLTTALWVEEHLGRDVLASAAGDRSAAPLVLGEADPDEVDRRRVLDPGDATACAALLVERGDAAVLDRPEADCLAAGALLARRAGDEEAAQRSLAALRVRWPDVWPEPGGRGGGSEEP